jgi:hypothetical protein
MSTTVLASDLHRMLLSVIPLACTDRVNPLPALQSVSLRSADDTLTLAATDRYVAGVTRAPATSTAPLVAMLSVDDAKDLARTIARRQGSATIGADDGFVVVTGLDFGRTYSDMSPHYEYPAIGRLFTDAFTRPESSDGMPSPFGVNPRLLRQFEAAAKAADSPIIVRDARGSNARGTLPPWLIECGPDFIGLFMTVRVDGAATSADDWADVLRAHGPVKHADATAA